MEYHHDESQGGNDKMGGQGIVPKAIGAGSGEVQASRIRGKLALQSVKAEQVEAAAIQEAQNFAVPEA